MRPEEAARENTEPFENPIPGAETVHAVQRPEVVDVEQDHRHAVLVALRAQRLLLEHEIEHCLRQQSRQRIPQHAGQLWPSSRRGTGACEGRIRSNVITEPGRNPR